ncbi:tail fiber domain-containing protein [Runella aurantiaca]|uniref:Tail fiber domain-containing protein n=1 Tax=Runella aurantiaca TaxID=2282308 RepID=A0A369I6D5_9BACT|nr:tail fiber domain-containing protein [Runella aurantiaca]RDB05329.1 tail fiber domain-containing protein [Runella aurantiaca]
MKNFASLWLVVLVYTSTFAQGIFPDRVTIPKMSTVTKNALPNKTEGMMVYDSDLKQFSYWTGQLWANFGSTAASGTGWQLIGNDLSTTNTGNVGVGISVPTRGKFEVFGALGNGPTSAVFGSDGTGLSLQRNWPTIGFNQYRDGSNVQRRIGEGYAATQFFDPNTGAMFINTFGTGVANSTSSFSVPTGIFTLLSNGNIGVRNGGSSNTGMWITRGATNTNGSLVVSGTTHNSHFHYDVAEDTYIRAGKNNSRVVLNDIPGGNVVMGAGNGKFGINSGNPQYTLEIKQAANNTGLVLINNTNFNNWELRSEVYSTDNGTDCLMAFYNNSLKGWMRPTDGGWSENSDRRLKKNIQNLESVLDQIMLLRPARYQMIDSNPNATEFIGFIAQELKEVFPEVVDVRLKPTKHGAAGEIADLHGVDYAHLSVVAIKAIQEQQGLIEKLQKQNEELVQSYTQLMKDVETLKKK